MNRDPVKRRHVATSIAWAVVAVVAVLAPRVLDTFWPSTVVNRVNLLIFQ